MLRPPPTSPLFPYTTLFRSQLPIVTMGSIARTMPGLSCGPRPGSPKFKPRSEEHTSELQSHHDLVCRLLLEKKKKHLRNRNSYPQHQRALERRRREDSDISR